MEGAVWSFYIQGGIWRKLFGAFILIKRYYKEWRDLFRTFILAERYNRGGEIWIGLIGALISAERYYKGRRDLEEAIWRLYN